MRYQNKKRFKLAKLPKVKNFTSTIHNIYKPFFFIFIMVKGRKVTGGKYKDSRKKKNYASPGIPRKVKLRETKQKKIDGRGKTTKNVLLSTDKANIIDPKTKKAKKVTIKNVLETPSNRFLARQNILVKGAIVETELGKARITNRPSQEGSVQGELLHE